MSSARNVGITITAFWLLFLTTDVRAISGNEWKQLSAESRQAYVRGVVDAWGNLAAMLRSNRKEYPNPAANLFMDVALCLKSNGMTYAQVHAIVEKYINENPSEWHYDMASLTWAAIHKACQATRQ